MLSRQLVLAFLLVTLPATALLGLVSLRSLQSLGAISEELGEILVSLESTRDLELAVMEMNAPVVGYIRSGDERLRGRLEGSISRVEARLSSCGTASCHQMSRTPASMAASVSPLVDRLKHAGRAVFEAPTGRRPDGPTSIHTISDLARDIQERLDSMTLTLLARVAELTRRSAAVSHEASILTWWLMIGIAVTAGTAGLVIARRLAMPLRDLLLGIRRVMEGHWSHRVAAEGPAETVELGRAFNAMAEEVERSRERLEEANRTLEARVRRRTAELQHKDQELAQAEKLASLGLLASGVAHELNNPLTSVLMNTNLLIEEVGSDSPLYADLKRIDADVGRCKRIIEDLRVFARRGDLEAVVSPVDELVEQALWSAGAELERRGVKVDKDVPPDLPEAVLDPQRIVQVLTNLFVNAAQAMEPGGRLTVRSRCEDGWLRLEVQDSGPGISPELRSQIFDPFFTTKRDGTGLGLSISHGIVTKHRGQIEVETRTREEAGPDGATGTTVRVTLPVQGPRW